MLFLSEAHSPRDLPEGCLWSRCPASVTDDMHALTWCVPAAGWSLACHSVCTSEHEELSRGESRTGDSSQGCGPLRENTSTCLPATPAQGIPLLQPPLLSRERKSHQKAAAGNSRKTRQNEMGPFPPIAPQVPDTHLTDTESQPHQEAACTTVTWTCLGSTESRGNGWF